MSDSIFAWQPPASVADNDDADSTINWSEGQNPSTVNNSARAVMARVSEFLSDLLTLKTTGGTGAAYTVTATQQPASLPNGFTVYLLPHATNTGTCTLNVNGLGAKPLRLTSAANAAAGDIVINKPIHATYYETGNEFLVDAANASGALTDIVGDTTPQLGGPLDTNGQGINESEGAAVASAATPDIWATDGNTVHITGTTQIDDFADAPRIGARRKLVFDGALTLTHGSGITLPGGANITTAAGDMAEVYADAVNAFRVVYTKADGTAVVASTGGGPSVGTNAIIRTNAKNIITDITLSDHETTFTADAGADTLSVGTDDGFADEDTVYLTTTGTLPAGLSTSTEYYVVSAAASTLQLAATNGGSAINITDAGTGTHTIYQAINGMSAGPITIESGHTVTIPEGSTWSIV